MVQAASSTQADADNLSIGAATLSQESSGQHNNHLLNREQDADGFFILQDEEIEQIMACCKPMA